MNRAETPEEAVQGKRKNIPHLLKRLSRLSRCVDCWRLAFGSCRQCGEPLCFQRRGDYYREIKHDTEYLFVQGHGTCKRCRQQRESRDVWEGTPLDNNPLFP